MKILKYKKANMAILMSDKVDFEQSFRKIKKDYSQ